MTLVEFFNTQENDIVLEDIDFYRNKPDDGIVVHRENAKLRFFTRNDNTGNKRYYVQQSDGSEKEISDKEYEIARDGIDEYNKNHSVSSSNNAIISNKLTNFITNTKNSVDISLKNIEDAQNLFLNNKDILDNKDINDLLENYKNIISNIKNQTDELYKEISSSDNSYNSQKNLMQKSWNLFLNKENVKEISEHCDKIKKTIEDKIEEKKQEEIKRQEKERKREERRKRQEEIKRKIKGYIEKKYGDIKNKFDDWKKKIEDAKKKKEEERRKKKEDQEFDKQFYIGNFLTEDVQKQLGESFVKELNDNYKNAPQNVQEFLRKNLSMVNVLSTSSKDQDFIKVGSAHFEPNTNPTGVRLDNSTKNKRRFHTFFHEAGHAIDWNITLNLGNNSSRGYVSFKDINGKNFAMIILNETRKHIKERAKDYATLSLEDYFKKYNIKVNPVQMKIYEHDINVLKKKNKPKDFQRKVFKKLFELELYSNIDDTETISSLCDFISMSTKGDYHIGGHDKKYCQLGGVSSYTATEAFAELTAAYCYKENIKFYEKYFPEAVKFYNEIIDTYK